MPEASLSSLLGARIRIGGLRGEARALDIEADAGARQAVAAELGILGIDGLAANLSVTPFRGGVRVTGRVNADLHQQCVVTLEPVAERIGEPVDRVFLPAEGATGEHRGGGEVFVDPEADDEPDWFEGEWLDLGPLIVETLSLALNPYPRAPGATLVPVGAGEGAGDVSPFAALKRLKRSRRAK
ncbi:MAG: DUF177 domain-containing protein [Cucumibacter sp.]